MYVAAFASYNGALSEFAGAANGKTSDLGCIWNTHSTPPAACNQQANLAGADSVAVSPDGKNTYTTAAVDNGSAPTVRTCTSPPKRAPWH